MKQIKMIAILFLLFFMSSHHSFAQTSIEGAWTKQEGSFNITLLFQDGYYSYTKYDVANKVFSFTKGGSYKADGNKLSITYLFHTAEKEKVSSSETMEMLIDKQTLSLSANGTKEVYSRVDDSKGALGGHWLITGRMNNGNMQTITPGARRTIKLLTGTRFQWIAINIETKEFFGTGGGSYSFVNGKYTENIEFFSRDSTRVGASLSFDGKVEGNNWHHSGLSSRGEPIHEIWTKGL
ncbi:membrane or secreted protein [Lacibacter sediminis]|uniref:Membrane or secreted protein n=1 Tax=Lacibacter sediminis TaxID=2760713 RepID=A0A7G5XCC5_9BACT|nr:membrane or secreted protein [Lacibacter sediminis]QNA43128.1 membrane or secreted protein [Lacibacter sediminis]